MLCFAVRAMLALSVVFGVAVAAGVGVGLVLPQGDWEQLLFIGNTGLVGNSEVAIRDLNKGFTVKITRYDDFMDISPIKALFSPDGHTIAIQFMNEIHVFDRIGSKSQLLTSESESDSPFFWMPDSKSIAYYTGREAEKVLVVQGNDRRTIENVWRNDLYFSSGGEIAVLQWATGMLPKLYLTKDFQSDDLNQLIAEDVFDPTWSPDGKKIAFFKGVIDIYVGIRSKGIYVYDVEEKTVNQITTYGKGPFWSADSSQILFSNNETNAFEVVDIVSKEIEVYYHIQDDPLLHAFSYGSIDWRPAKN